MCVCVSMGVNVLVCLCVCGWVGEWVGGCTSVCLCVPVCERTCVRVGVNTCMYLFAVYIMLLNHLKPSFTLAQLAGYVLEQICSDCRFVLARLSGAKM